MTKEEAKNYIDNGESFLRDLGSATGNLSAKLQEQLNELSDNFTNLNSIYEFYQNNLSDTLQKYNIDFDAFKMIYSLYGLGESIIGKENYSNLCKFVMQTYGKKGYEILGVNSYDDIPKLEMFLESEAPNYYTDFVKEMCKEAPTLYHLKEILNFVKEDYIDDQLVEGFFEKDDLSFSSSEFNSFASSVPSQMWKSEIMKSVLEKVDKIDSNILRLVTENVFDDKDFIDWFETNGLDLMDKKFDIHELPESLITDEKVRTWYENKFIDLTNNEDFDLNSYIQLPPHLKLGKITEELTKKISSSNFNKDAIYNFFNSIPKNQITKETYEFLIDKCPRIVEQLPQQSFIEGLSQDDYNKWVDNLIVETAKKTDNIEDIVTYLPRERFNSTTWNTICDRCEELGKGFVSIKHVPIYNREEQMLQRALDNNPNEFVELPCVDINLDRLSPQLREEYKNWLNSLSEEKKQEYRKWYEEKAISFLERDYHSIHDIGKFSSAIPFEALTPNILKAYLDIYDVTAFEHIPLPSELTSYNSHDFEDIILYTIEKNLTYHESIDVASKKDLLDEYDLLSNIPEEYRTDKVILEAIKQHPKYLSYVDNEVSNFEELVRIGYKNQLEQLGKEDFSPEEYELIKEFRKNNANLFATLDIRIFNPEIMNCINTRSLERICRYKDLENKIIYLSQDSDKLRVFNCALENLQGSNLFIEPLIEQLADSIDKDFSKIVSERLQSNSSELSDEEQTIISYLALNPNEARNIKKYDDISTYVINKNEQLDEIMTKNNLSLIEAKNTYLERVVGISYDKAVEIVQKYGRDAEELLHKYQSKEPQTFKEKSEKESLEVALKIKSLIDEENIDNIKNAYRNATKETLRESYERYKYATLLDNSLRRAYGRELAQTLNDHSQENYTETTMENVNGEKYVIRKLNGPFNRMISVMGAYRGNKEKGDMYDKWNTNKMAENHALCYSLINEKNPGTALIYDNDGMLRNGVIVSIENFDAEAVTAEAPHDLNSYSGSNTTITERQQIFYLTNNMPDNTRGNYSEFVVEVQDVSGNSSKYKKIQPASIICFEEADENSINAAIDLSKKLGRVIPIEIIDRRELAKVQHDEITDLLDKFKTSEQLHPEYVEQIITKFNNVRNAHRNSSLRDELLGERPGYENEDAPFNKSNLNHIISECIEVAQQKIVDGKKQEGLDAIESIKAHVTEEIKKQETLPTMYEKQLRSGIDISVYQQIDRVQRQYTTAQEHNEPDSLESLRILEKNDHIPSTTFDMKSEFSVDKQLELPDVKKVIDFDEIKEAMKDVQQKGYYRNNETYSEDHVSRVMIFANAIANESNIENHDKKLLFEAVKYYSCGRQLDVAEPHEKYSAEIAGKELQGKLDHTDISIVQAAIELQNFDYYKNIDNIVTKDQKAKEVADKYGLSEEETKKARTLSVIIRDSVTLNQTRFLTKVGYNSPLDHQSSSFETDAAKRLEKFSYSLHDKLAEEHLQAMAKVCQIDYQEYSVKSDMLSDFVVESVWGNKRTQPDDITKSPIAREMYFRKKFPEIENPEKLDRSLAPEKKTLDEKQKKEYLERRI